MVWQRLDETRQWTCRGPEQAERWPHCLNTSFCTLPLSDALHFKHNDDMYDSEP